MGTDVINILVIWSLIGILHSTGILNVIHTSTLLYNQTDSFQIEDQATDLSVFVCHNLIKTSSSIREGTGRYNDYQYFGGAIAMTSDQIEKINGFPNQFFGWGGEDDEIRFR